jgi:hypothetical protein
MFVLLSERLKRGLCAHNKRIGFNAPWRTSRTLAVARSGAANPTHALSSRRRHFRPLASAAAAARGGTREEGDRSVALRRSISQLLARRPLGAPGNVLSPHRRGLAAIFNDHSPVAFLGRYDWHSDAFRDNVVSLVLDAYPEKKRLIAIHIPKCAGTHLRARLATRYPLVHKDLENPQRTPLPLLSEKLRALSLSIPAADAILVNGHRSLCWYLERGLLRPDDSLFAVVRAPRKIIISYVNHMLTRFLADPELVEPDTSDWARLLGLSPTTLDRSLSGMKALGRRLLREPLVQHRNPLCSHLGDGDFVTAMRAMRRSNIEITDVTRYDSASAFKNWVTSRPDMSDNCKSIRIKSGRYCRAQTDATAPSPVDKTT